MNICYLMNVINFNFTCELVLGLPEAVIPSQVKIKYQAKYVIVTKKFLIVDHLKQATLM